MRSKTFLAVPLFIVAFTVPSFAGLIIKPTFDPTINSDANAAAIKATVLTAINFYQAAFADNFTANITFASSNTGLGGSSFSLFAVPYANFYTALSGDAKSPDDATAMTRLATDGSGGTSPVPGSNNTIVMKSANMKALGLVGFGEPPPTSSDGTITINTTITTPGSPGTSGQYDLLSTVEHEINEILGLGSTLGLGLNPPFNNDASPEDFFRFVTGNVRSFSLVAGTPAFFSLNGTTNLANFYSPGCNGCSDYGDWDNASLRVQNASATIGGTPFMTMSSVETRALDAIGYDLVVVPEPGTMLLMSAGLLALAGFRARKS